MESVPGLVEPSGRSPKELRALWNNISTARRSDETEVVPPHRLEQARAERAEREEREAWARLQAIWELEIGEATRLACKLLAAQAARDEEQAGVPPPPPKINDVMRATCEHFNITRADLLSERRSPDITYPRQLAMYLCFTEAKRSYSSIGRACDRDHTTALSSVRKIRRLIPNRPHISFDIAAIKRRLGVE